MVRAWHGNGYAIDIGHIQKTNCGAVGRTQVLRYLQTVWHLVPALRMKRILSRTESVGDCLLWNGAKDKDGYGIITRRLKGKKRTLRLSRYVWFLVHGEWPPQGQFVCHRCDAPSCVNPKHFFLGTHLENMKDMVSKKRTGNRGHGRHAIGEGTGSAILTSSEVVQIRRLYSGGGVSYMELANRYKTSKSTIGAVLKRKTWAHL